MTLLTEPTRIVLRKTWQPMDTDAAAYITAVETADGQALEEKTKIAIDNFVIGCKQDGIWPAIKASCILAGARTLAGALVPLVGTAPTNNNFVSGDYSRETGLVGNGSTKYLNSNRNNNADPQNSKHIALFASTLPTLTCVNLGAGAIGVAGRSILANFGANTPIRVNSTNALEVPSATGFAGASRAASGSFVARVNKLNYSSATASDVPVNETIGVFALTLNTSHSDSRLAFYSIGESLDLARLDSRVTDLINAFAAAIP